MGRKKVVEKKKRYVEPVEEDPVTGLCACCAAVRVDDLRKSLEHNFGQISATSCKVCSEEAKESSTTQHSKGKKKQKHQHNNTHKPSRSTTTLVCLRCAFSGCEDHCFRHHNEHLHGKKTHSLFLLLDENTMVLRDFKMKCYDCGLDVSDDVNVHNETSLDPEETNDEGYLISPCEDLRMGVQLACSAVVDTVLEGEVVGFSDTQNRPKLRGKAAKMMEKQRKKNNRQNHNHWKKQHGGGGVDATAKQIGLKGLTNFGNTCFFNSAIQAVSATPALPTLLQAIQSDESPLGTLTTTSVGCLLKLQDRSDRCSVTPQLRLLHSEVQRLGPQFRGSDQHDTHEFLRFLFDTISMEYEGVSSMNPFSHLFGGLLQSTVQCGLCRNRSKTKEEFFDLSLPLTSSLQGSLALFFAEESLEPGSYTCPTCNTEQHNRLLQRKTEEKRLALERLRENEVGHKITLKDVIADSGEPEEEDEDGEGSEESDGTASPDEEGEEDSPRSEKEKEEQKEEQKDEEEAPIEKVAKKPAPLPVVRTDAYKQYSIMRGSRCVALHLKRFYFDRQSVSFAKNKQKVDIPDTLELDAFLSGDGEEEDEKEKEKEGGQYTLYATIEHQGELGYGHYVAHVKREGRWFECSDTCVSASSRSAAVKMPYVVFYAKA